MAAEQRDRADVPTNVLTFPKTIELEQRLARTELLVEDLQQLLSVFQKRVIALQAQLDHLSAKMDRY